MWRNTGIHRTAAVRNTLSIYVLYYSYHSYYFNVYISVFFPLIWSPFQVYTGGPEVSGFGNADTDRENLRWVWRTGVTDPVFLWSVSWGVGSPCLLRWNPSSHLLWSTHWPNLFEVGDEAVRRSRSVSALRRQHLQVVKWLMVPCLVAGLVELKCF